MDGKIIYRSDQGKKKKKLKTLKSVMAKKRKTNLLDNPVLIGAETYKHGFISPITDWENYSELLEEVNQAGVYFKEQNKEPMGKIDADWHYAHVRLDNLVSGLFSSGRYITKNLGEISELIFSEVPEYPYLKLAVMRYHNNDISHERYVDLTGADYGGVFEDVYDANKKMFPYLGLHMMFQDQKNSPYFGLLIPMLNLADRITIFSRKKKLGWTLKKQLNNVYGYIALITFNETSNLNIMMFHDAYYDIRTMKTDLKRIINLWGQPQ